MKRKIALVMLMVMIAGSVTYAGTQNGFVKERGNYYLYQNGVKRTKTGWYTYKGQKIYINKGGKLKHYEKFVSNGKTYVFAKANPRVCKSVTTTIKGKWFTCDSQGVVQQHQFWDSTTVYKQGDYALTRANGCMPTSLAMIVTDLTRQRVTPVQMATYLQDAGKWTQSGGGAGDGIRVAANRYGLKYRYYSASEYKQALSFMRTHNALMIARQRYGTFTNGTHFIAIVDVNGDNVVVHNPGAKGSNGTYSFEKAVKPYLYDCKGTNNEAICVLWK